MVGAATTRRARHVKRRPGAVLDAPVLPVVRSYVENVGPGACLEGGLRQLRSSHLENWVRTLILALRHTVDVEVSSAGGAIPELIFRDGIAIRIYHRVQGRGRDRLTNGRAGVGGSHDRRMIYRT